MPIYIIDTNIFLRVLAKEDPQAYSECFKLLEQIKENKLEAIVPGLVLSEMVWTLKSFYQLPKNQVIQLVEGILNLSGLKVVDGYDYRIALENYQKNSVKYIDSCLASMEVITKNQAIIISYDKDFDKLGVKRLEPQQVIEK